MNEGTQKFVKLVIGTVKGSYFYATTWDMFAWPKAPRSQVQDFKEKLPEYIEGIEDEQLKSAYEVFLEKCGQAENSDPKFDYMESDLLVEVFVELMAIVENSATTAAMELKNKDLSCTKQETVSVLRQALKGLAQEMEEKRKSAAAG